MRALSGALGGRRVWLLLDEWSSVPRDLQPYLAEFIARCVLPLQGFTVKIAAIEQQTNFHTMVDGRAVGIELGADMGAHINLDDFLVYEGNADRPRDFFRRLFHKQVRSVAETSGLATLSLLATPADVIRVGFTDSRAFDELVRAAEGVPRDAIYIAARAASRAGQELLSVPGVRTAAQSWYQTDKSRPLSSREQAQRPLEWIITKVIPGEAGPRLPGQPARHPGPASAGPVRRTGTPRRPAGVLGPGRSGRAVRRLEHRLRGLC